MRNRIGSIMPRMTRTFIAIPVPATLRVKLERLQGLVAPTVEGAHWIAPEGFHLTLAFVGDVHDPDLNGLCNGVARSVGALSRFELEIRGLGAFPDLARPRVLWAGIVGDLDALATTQSAAFEAATAAGYRPADDRFHPHITLARIKTARGPAVDLGPIAAQHAGWVAGTFTVDTVIVYSSSMGSEGPTYATLGKAPLSRPLRS